METKANPFVMTPPLSCRTRRT